MSLKFKTCLWSVLSILSYLSVIKVPASGSGAPSIAIGIGKLQLLLLVHYIKHINSWNVLDIKINNVARLSALNIQVATDLHEKFHILIEIHAIL